jgi:hypothetical protein
MSSEEHAGNNFPETRPSPRDETFLRGAKGENCSRPAPELRVELLTLMTSECRERALVKLYSANACEFDANSSNQAV